MVIAVDPEKILERVNRVSTLVDRLAKVRDLADQTETSERIQRELTAIRQIVQPLE